jgi:hypothetical protein
MSHEGAINFPSYLALISYFDASLTVSLHNFGALYFSDTNKFQFLECQYSYRLRKWSWQVKLTANFLPYSCSTTLCFLAMINLRAWRWRQKILPKS